MAAGPRSRRPRRLQWLRGALSGGAAHCGGAAARGRRRARASRALDALGAQLGVPLVASGDVHMHVRARRRLQDALTAIRLSVPIAEAGCAAVSERRALPARARAAGAAVSAAAARGERWQSPQGCHFRLDELRYEYPRELVPAGETAGQLPAQADRGRRRAGAGRGGIPASRAQRHRARARAHRRARLRAVLPHRARHRRLCTQPQGILCQGRGSAANSRVCYCLGVTSVDPQRGAALLFERFISRERNEPPDIDIDFEHERREEVLQYVYAQVRPRARGARRHRHHVPPAQRAARPRQGVRPRRRTRAARSPASCNGGTAARRMAERVRAAGFDPEAPWLQAAAAARRASSWLSRAFPRHLSQHVGGFVIAAGTARGAGADRERRHARAHRGAVGQG